MAKNTNIKIGIIGFGRIGKVHAQNILDHVDNATLTRICDPFLNEEHSDWLKRKGALDVSLSRDPLTLFSDGQIDAVLVCSSTDSH